jgi:hypothetical protein
LALGNQLINPIFCAKVKASSQLRSPSLTYCPFNSNSMSGKSEPFVDIEYVIHDSPQRLDIDIDMIYIASPPQRNESLNCPLFIEYQYKIESE